MNTSVIFQGVLVVSLLFCGCVFAGSQFCSFDNGTCGYTNKDPSRRTQWVLRREVKFHGFPITDHTSGNGSFMYPDIHWSYGTTKPIYAQLISPPMWNVTCVQFYYYRTFLISGQLDVLTEIGGKTSLVWTVESSDTSEWKFASIPITSKKGESIKIVFQVVLLKYSYYHGITALIDDVRVTSDVHSCKLHPALPISDRLFKEVQGSCNFDTSTCGYHNNRGTNVWKRGRGSRWFRGLIDDHTFKIGMYFYVSDYGLPRGRKSYLISPVLTTVQCVTFYYHMSGKYVGELNVYTRVQNTDKRVLKLSGNYGDQWQKATIYLDNNAATSSSFRLVFESVRGNGYGRDIAIDDISTSNNCRRPTTRPRRAGNTTMVRLVNSYDQRSGRVEVLHDGKWGTICHKSWTIEDATVVCKMKGFTGAEKAYQSYGSGSGDIWLSNVQCTGKEKSISECSHAEWGVNKCLHSQDVGVVCRAADSNNIVQRGSCTFDRDLCGYKIEAKSTNASMSWTSRVEKWSGGQDGIVEITRKSSAKAGVGTKLISPILPSSTKCVMFSYLMSMQLDYLSRTDRDNYLYGDEDIGTLNVYLKPFTSNTLTKVWTLSGRQYVEYIYSKVPVNANGNKQFQVVFEYISGMSYEADIRIDSITMLNRSCGILPLKAIPDASDVHLRLRDGKTNMEGRVEVYYDGVWGTVNDYSWDLPVATVACRQLKFAGAVGTFSETAFGQALINGPVWTQDSFYGDGCKGNETNIARCLDNISNFNRNVPGSEYDAGVECFDARLVGGRSPNEGRVEINYKGKWGTVCNKGWNMKSAKVICRDLGYRRAKAISSFGRGTGEIRLSNVRCTGDEVSISSCFYRGWIVHDCDHSQDVGVVCTNDKSE